MAPVRVGRYDAVLSLLNETRLFLQMYEKGSEGSSGDQCLQDKEKRYYV